MSIEEKRAYNREASKRYREKVKDTDDFKQKILAFVNKYLENNRQKVYEYQKVYKSVVSKEERRIY